MLYITNFTHMNNCSYFEKSTPLFWVPPSNKRHTLKLWNSLQQFYNSFWSISLFSALFYVLLSYSSYFDHFVFCAKFLQNVLFIFHLSSLLLGWIFKKKERKKNRIIKKKKKNRIIKKKKRKKIKKKKYNIKKKKKKNRIIKKKKRKK